jgi:hypothetical protein
MRRIAVLAAVPLLLIAGCSGSPSAPAAAAATSAAAASSAAASPAAVKADVVHPLGKSVHENYFRVKVISFRPTVKLAGPPDDPDSHWAAAEVKFCWADPAKDAPDGVAVSWEPWSLLDGSSHRFSAFSTGSGYEWKSPVYPDGSDQGTSLLKLGDCVSGWIEFPVANGAKITQVRYSPEGDPSITWHV